MTCVQLRTPISSPFVETEAAEPGLHLTTTGRANGPRVDLHPAAVLDPTDGHREELLPSAVQESPRIDRTGHMWQ